MLSWYYLSPLYMYNVEYIYFFTMAVIYDISYLYLQNVIGRCSQPLVGPNGRRSREDEKLMTAFNVKALGQRVAAKKGFIIDTRTLTTISSAQAKGGGQESDAYYPGTVC